MQRKKEKAVQGSFYEEKIFFESSEEAIVRISLERPRGYMLFIYIYFFSLREFCAPCVFVFYCFFDVFDFFVFSLFSIKFLSFWLFFVFPPSLGFNRRYRNRQYFFSVFSFSLVIFLNISITFYFFEFPLSFPPRLLPPPPPTPLFHFSVKVLELSRNSISLAFRAWRHGRIGLLPFKVASISAPFCPRGDCPVCFCLFYFVCPICLSLLKSLLLYQFLLLHE